VGRDYYVSFLVIGLLSILRNMKAFGATLIVMGLVAAFLFYGAVNDALSPFNVVLVPAKFMPHNVFHGQGMLGGLAYRPRHMDKIERSTTILQLL